MIQITRLNKSVLTLNAEWIETIEATPDTIITLTNGKRYVVTESVDEVVKRVIEYKRNAGLVHKTPIASVAYADKD